MRSNRGLNIGVGWKACNTWENKSQKKVQSLVRIAHNTSLHNFSSLDSQTGKRRSFLINNHCVGPNISKIQVSAKKRSDFTQQGPLAYGTGLFQFRRHISIRRGKKLVFITSIWKAINTIVPIVEPNTHHVVDLISQRFSALDTSGLLSDGIF